MNLIAEVEVVVAFGRPLWDGACCPGCGARGSGSGSSRTQGVWPDLRSVRTSVDGISLKRSSLSVTAVDQSSSSKPPVSAVGFKLE